jgi:hypothetical protein
MRRPVWPVAPATTTFLGAAAARTAGGALRIETASPEATTATRDSAARRGIPVYSSASAVIVAAASGGAAAPRRREGDGTTWDRKRASPEPEHGAKPWAGATMPSAASAARAAVPRLSMLIAYITLLRREAFVASSLRSAMVKTTFHTHERASDWIDARHMQPQGVGPFPGSLSTPRLRFATSGPCFGMQGPARLPMHQGPIQGAPQVLAVRKVILNQPDKITEGRMSNSGQTAPWRLLHRQGTPMQADTGSLPLRCIEDFLSTLPEGGSDHRQMPGQNFASSYGNLVHALGFAVCASTLPLLQAPQTTKGDTLVLTYGHAATYGLAATSNMQRMQQCNNAIMMALVHAEEQKALSIATGSPFASHAQTSELLGVLKHAKKTGTDGFSSLETQGKSMHAMMASQPQYASGFSAECIPGTASTGQATAKSMVEGTQCEVGFNSVMC